LILTLQHAGNTLGLVYDVEMHVNERHGYCHWSHVWAGNFASRCRDEAAEIV
jgi:hypothetical protein